MTPETPEKALNNAGSATSATADVASLPRVLLKPRRAQPFHFRHPWVYQSAVHGVSGRPEPGAEVAVFTSEGDFVARGLFNPDSQILVRLYSWDPDAALDAAFWDRKIASALALRKSLPAPWGVGEDRDAPFAANTGCRLVFSEADGLSGLIVDRYGEWLLTQFTSRALFQRRELILNALAQRLSPRGVWLRTEKGMRDSEGLEAVDGLISGEPPPRPLLLTDQEVQYQVDVVEGQKTGFYLDQSANRRAAARYCRGGHVLDLFCYSGGFSITAAKAGAASVLGVDVSESALGLAAENARLNGVEDRVSWEKAKAFDLMERFRDEGRSFDALILDPPKMARHRASLTQAMKGYFSLNRLAVDLLRPGGILITCSCTGLVSADEFRELLCRVAVNSRRSIRILETHAASPDHPTSASCPETDYLKCVIASVE